MDPNGHLYAAGAFTQAGGAAANRIARWDGGAWSPLGSGISGGLGSVRALVLDGKGNLYAGGDFPWPGTNLLSWPNGSTTNKTIYLPLILR